MKRLDLIIDALESCDEKSWSMTFDSEKVQEALAAARELRALEPVAFIENHKAGKNLSWTKDDLPYAKATPLYALGESE